MQRKSMVLPRVSAVLTFSLIRWISTPTFYVTRGERGARRLNKTHRFRFRYTFSAFDTIAKTNFRPLHVNVKNQCTFSELQRLWDDGSRIGDKVWSRSPFLTISPPLPSTARAVLLYSLLLMKVLQVGGPYCFFLNFALEILSPTKLLKWGEGKRSRE